MKLTSRQERLLKLTFLDYRQSMEFIADPLILNTLAEDPTDSHESALLRIYRRLHPGSPQRVPPGLPAPARARQETRSLLLPFPRRRPLRAWPASRLGSGDRGFAHSGAQVAAASATHP